MEDLFYMFSPREIGILSECNPLLFCSSRCPNESSILCNETDVRTLPEKPVQSLHISEITISASTFVVSPLITYTVFLGSAARSFNTETTLGCVVKTIPGPLAQATNVPKVSALQI